MGKHRALPPFGESPVEVEEARKRLTREQCPRRYCWYWHSLSFDWVLTPEEGCGVAKEHIGDAMLKRQGAEIHPWRQCSRASGNPQHADLYEPREPHLEADGWPADFFQVVGKVARLRRLARRQRSGRSRGGRRDD
jgi:hypothetical protein